MGQAAAFAAPAVSQRLHVQSLWARRGPRVRARQRLPSAGAWNLCATGLLEYGGEMATLDESMAIFRIKQKRAEVLSGLPVS
jgi:hypothetical protein